MEKWWQIGLFLLIFSLVVVWVTIKFSQKIKARKLHKLVSQGRKAEREAVSFLQQKGYQILQEQVEKNFFLRVDGQKVKCNVRADFLVKKGRKLFVAEVKTGHQATNYTRPTVRRQLLEYYWVYQTKGVLLVDGENWQIRQIDFPQSSKKVNRLEIFIWSSVFLLIGFVLSQWITI
ncbi:MAG: hypothetical protein PWP04_723 [Candidatus Atribacteria bacterium]|nr:hypothetical protein [Candidatus Atribacteria bacterium]